MTRASPLLRGATAAAVVATFGAGALAALDVPSWAERHGLSNFGRPPELGLLSLAVAAASAGWLLWPAPRARRSVAQLTTLLLLSATLLGSRVIPNDDALRLALTATTLWAAAPWLSWRRPSTLIGAAALLLAGPALAATQYPHGGLVWLTHIAPVAALAVCLPAAFDSARVPLLTLVVSAALAGLASASSYPIAAAALDIPLGALLSTRLTVLGLHPNLAVPLLAVAATLGIAAFAQGPRRAGVGAALLVVGATLLAVRSRTGLAVTVVGVGLFLAWRWAAKRERLARAARLAWVALVAALLLGTLVPATNWTSGTITTQSASMTSKAVTFRSAMWELGRASWAAADWHGHGPGTLYEQGTVARPGRYDGMTKSDHPHSIVLLVGGALGFPGLLALALLFAWTTRPPRRHLGEADAALACAAVALWAANAADLGGAINTLYPALAFVLLGLRDVRNDDSDAASPSALPARLVGGLSLASLAVVGIVLSAQRRAVHTASEQLAHLDDAEARSEAGDMLDDTLARAAALVPTDPGVPMLRAQLAARASRPAEALQHIDEALARFPRSAMLQHQRAMALWLAGGPPAEIDAALDAAIALDAWGPDTWRRHIDRARIASGASEPDVARRAIAAALVSNPEAAADIPLIEVAGQRVFTPTGPGGARIPVDAVRADLAAMRLAWEDRDPAYATRFALREVEVLRAIGDFEGADARAQEMDVGNSGVAPYYEHLLRGRASASAGRHDEAAEHFAQANALYSTSAQAKSPGQLDGLVLTEELEALSHAEALDAEGFAERSALVTDILGDLRFRTAEYRRWIDARRRVAERTGDVALAARLHDALGYLER